MTQMLIPRLFVCVALFLASGVVQAQALAPPMEKVVLTVRGMIGKTNGAGAAHFDMAMLNALAQHTIRTGTPWYPGTSEFSGPLLADLLKLVEAKGSVILASALNDYSVTVPVSDAREHRMVLATLLNGKPMSIREKGPIFLVYPFDSKPELRGAAYYERSVWQLKSLDVR